MDTRQYEDDRYDILNEQQYTIFSTKLWLLVRERWLKEELPKHLFQISTDAIIEDSDVKEFMDNHAEDWLVNRILVTIHVEPVDQLWKDKAAAYDLLIDPVRDALKEALAYFLCKIAGNVCLYFPGATFIEQSRYGSDPRILSDTLRNTFYAPLKGTDTHAPVAHGLWQDLGEHILSIIRSPAFRYRTAAVPAFPLS
jgi:hypothetical protein